MHIVVWYILLQIHFLNESAPQLLALYLIFRNDQAKENADCVASHERWLKAAFTPGQHVARQHIARNMLPVAVNMLLVIGNKIVASLLSVCCWIQRIQVDRDINEKIMLPRYSQHAARYKQHSNMLPSTYMLTAACCHGVNAALVFWNESCLLIISNVYAIL